MITAKVIKSGNDLIVVLPDEVVDSLQIHEGDLLVFEIKDGNLIVSLTKP